MYIEIRSGQIVTDKEYSKRELMKLYPSLSLPRDQYLEEIKVPLYEVDDNGKPAREPGAIIKDDEGNTMVDLDTGKPIREPYGALKTPIAYKTYKYINEAIGEAPEGKVAVSDGYEMADGKVYRKVRYEDIMYTPQQLQAYISEYTNAMLLGTVEFEGEHYSLDVSSRTFFLGTASRAIIEDDKAKKHRIHPPKRPSVLMSNQKIIELSLFLADQAQAILDVKEVVQAAVTEGIYTEPEQIKSAIDTGIESWKESRTT